MVDGSTYIPFELKISHKNTFDYSWIQFWRCQYYWIKHFRRVNEKGANETENRNPDPCLP